MRWRLAAAALVLVAAVFAAAALYWKGRIEGHARAAAQVAAAAAATAAAQLEAEGERQNAAHTAAAVARRSRADAVVAEFSQDALKSEDADAPLDPDRVARLRLADGRLCDTAPELAGCATTGDAP